MMNRKCFKVQSTEATIRLLYILKYTHCEYKQIHHKLDNTRLRFFVTLLTGVRSNAMWPYNIIRFILL
jgi:hypothetical protein